MKTRKEVLDRLTFGSDSVIERQVLAAFIDASLKSKNPFEAAINKACELNDKTAEEMYNWIEN